MTTTTYDQESLVTNIMDGLSKVDPMHPACARLSPYLYRMNSKLPQYWSRFVSLLSNKKSKGHSQAIGKLLEQVAWLAFSGLSGSELDSYQSAAGPQYDLVINGRSARWCAVTKYLNLGEAPACIVVETKAWKTKVKDQQFSRLCAILDHNLKDVARLGVLISLEGATGFPGKGPVKRKRQPSDSQLRQLLFYAHTKSFVIVFDRHDLEALSKGECLVTMLKKKILDVCLQSGLGHISPLPDWQRQRLLPSHLKEVS